MTRALVFRVVAHGFLQQQRAAVRRPSRVARSAVVALTREQGKNAGLKRALEQDLRTVEVPCVETRRTAAMETALDAALLFVDEPWDWVVVTSPEAAKTFGDAALRSGLFMMRDPRWRGFRLAAVGAATAAALEARENGGFKEIYAPDTATARSLAASLPRNDGRAVERVLYPASALAARAEEAGLNARHAALDAEMGRLGTPRSPSTPRSSWARSRTTSTSPSSPSAARGPSPCGSSCASPASASAAPTSYL